MDLADGLDDIDQLNDETFGHDMMGGGDWELEHKKHAFETNCENDYDDDDAEPTSTSKYATQNDLESRISQLVVEEEELDDPAIMSVRKSMPMFVNPSSHQEGFKASSPPAFLDTLDNLLDPDKDIWGSPVKTNFVDQLLGVLKKPSESHQAAAGNIWAESSNLSIETSTEPHSPSTDSLEHRRAGGSKESAGTQPLLPPASYQSRPGSDVNGGGDWYTPVIASLPFPHVPFGTVGVGPVARPQHGQLQRPIGPAGHQPIMGPVPLMSAGCIAPRQSLLGLPPPLRMPMQGPPFPVQLPAYYLPHQRPPPFNDSRGQSSGPFPAGVHSQMNYPLRQMVPNTAYHPLMRTPSPSPAGRYPTPYYGGQGSEGDGCIMTMREKEWIIKIQMIQLHSDDPFLDDYYYTMHSLKKRAAQHLSRQAADGDCDDGTKQLIIPALARVEMKDYKPVQFEGSLGKLTASSIHKPKQVLDVPGNSSEDGKHAGRDNQKYRKALVHIERSYDELLQVEDLDKKILSVPDSYRIDMLKKRETMLCQLHDRVSAAEHLPLYLPVRKGKLLIGRLLRLVSKAKAQALANVLLKNLPTAVKKDAAENVLARICRDITSVVAQSDVPNLVAFSEALTPHLHVTLQNKFVSRMVISMLMHAEEVYALNNEVDKEDNHKWESFVQSWTRCVAAGAVSPPVLMPQTCAGVANHAARFVDSGSLEPVRRAIESWTTT